MWNTRNNRNINVLSVPNLVLIVPLLPLMVENRPFVPFCSILFHLLMFITLCICVCSICSICSITFCLIRFINYRKKNISRWLSLEWFGFVVFHRVHCHFDAEAVFGGECLVVEAQRALLRRAGHRLAVGLLVVETHSGIDAVVFG